MPFLLSYRSGKKKIKWSQLNENKMLLLKHAFFHMMKEIE